MAQSRKRGGKKEHNKRLEKRNEKIKSDYQKATKEAWKKFEEYKAQKQEEQKDDFQYPDFK